MLRIILMGCSCLFLFGCVGVQVDRLPKETKYRDIQSISDISGIFKNQGFSQNGEWSPLFSDAFFPELTFSEPPSEVRIRNSNPLVFTVEAMSQGKVLAVRDLVQDQDFHLVDGELKLKRKLGDLVLSEAGAGVERESCVIRLTDTGDVVLTQRVGGGGLMLFVVPMVVSKVQEALFERIQERESGTGDSHAH